MCVKLGENVETFTKELEQGEFTGEIWLYTGNHRLKFENVNLKVVKSPLNGSVKVFHVGNVRFYESYLINQTDEPILLNKYALKVDGNTWISGLLNDPIVIEIDNTITVNLSFNYDVLPLYAMNESIDSSKGNAITLSYQSVDTYAQIPDVVNEPDKFNVYNTDYNNANPSSFVYSDIGLKGLFNPLSGDMTLLKDNYAINQSLKNLLLTNSYERPFSSQFIAGDIHSVLFDVNDEITAKELRTMVSTCISNYEPRIIVNDIKVINHVDNYAIELIMQYMIKSTSDVATFQTTINKL